MRSAPKHPASPWWGCRVAAPQTNMLPVVTKNAALHSPADDLTLLTPVEANRVIAHYMVQLGGPTWAAHGTSSQLTEQVVAPLNEHPNRSLEALLRTIAQYALTSIGMADVTEQQMEGAQGRHLRLAWQIIEGAKKDVDPVVRDMAVQLEQAIRDALETNGLQKHTLQVYARR